MNEKLNKLTNIGIKTFGCKIGLIGVLAFVPTVVGAYTSCADGVEITANTVASEIDGCDEQKCPSPPATFCRSNATMNYWSALAWCESIGGELASSADMCPNTNTSGPCYALKGTQSRTYPWWWTATISGTTKALVVVPGTGEIGPANRTTVNVNQYAAVCK